jgi:hypothetical protein
LNALAVAAVVAEEFLLPLERLYLVVAAAGLVDSHGYW